MSNYLPLDRSSIELLLQLVNVRNNITPPLTLSSVTIDPPISLTPTQVNFYQRNTRATVRALPDTAYKGDRIVYYNRIDIVQLFGQTQVPVDDEFETAEEALGLLNTKYGLAIDSNDLSDLELTPSGDVILTTGSSYVYMPNKTITILGIGDLLELERQADEFWHYVNYILPSEVGTVD